MVTSGAAWNWKNRSGEDRGETEGVRGCDGRRGRAEAGGTGGGGGALRYAGEPDGGPPKGCGWISFPIALPLLLFFFRELLSLFTVPLLWSF